MDIEEIIKDWLKENDIKISPRTHNFGIDEEKASYGMTLANKISRMLFKIIKSNPKATNEQLWNWLKQNFEKIIKQDSTEIAMQAYDHLKIV